MTGMLPGPHALCTAQLQGAPSQSQQHKQHLWSCGTQPAPLRRVIVTTSAEQVKVPGRQCFREIGPTPLAPAFWQNCLVGLSLRITWASSVLGSGSLCMLEPLPGNKTFHVLHRLRSKGASPRPRDWLSSLGLQQNPSQIGLLRIPLLPS